MLREADQQASMDSIANFQVRTWRIVDFWANEFEKTVTKSNKAQTELDKVEQALVKATRGNETLLQSIEES